MRNHRQHPRKPRVIGGEINMKYRILDLKNYESIVDEYLEVFADEFDYDSSKEMVKERKKTIY